MPRRLREIRPTDRRDVGNPAEAERLAASGEWANLGAVGRPDGGTIWHLRRTTPPKRLLLPSAEARELLATGRYQSLGSIPAPRED